MWCQRGKVKVLLPFFGPTQLAFVSPVGLVNRLDFTKMLIKSLKWAWKCSKHAQRRRNKEKVGGDDDGLRCV